MAFGERERRPSVICFGEAHAATFDLSTFHSRLLSITSNAYSIDEVYRSDYHSSDATTGFETWALEKRAI